MERKEWLAHRHQGIGSSDAAAIMGTSKWKTAIELYEEKILPEPPDEETGWILGQGNRWEPKIRELIELEELEAFTPVNLVMDGFPYIRASLDGRGASGKRICEIKIIGKDDWEKVKAGEVPRYYWAQVQHQLMFGFEECLFAAHLWEKEMTEVNIQKLAIIRVKPDVEYQTDMLRKEIEFWLGNVLKRVPPAMQAKDYKQLKEKGLTKVARDLAKWEAESKVLDKKIKNAKDVIVSAAKAAHHPRCMVGETVRVSEIESMGSVDYKKIPAVAGMTEKEFEQYRGPGRFTWKVEVLKEKKNEIDKD